MKQNTRGRSEEGCTLQNATPKTRVTVVTRRETSDARDLIDAIFHKSQELLLMALGTQSRILSVASLSSTSVDLKSAIMSQPQPEATDPKATNRARFELELEFVQSLANPYYLHSLAQQGILNQPAFVNFLKYLLYWKEKDYARFIL